jgi:3-oxoacyl-[acyl-carrier-protein] synthase III
VTVTSATIRTPARLPGARILAVGGHLPSPVVTSEETGARLGVTADWIRERTGIEQRHVAAPDETVADMAVAAGAKALAGAGLDPADVGLVIVATSTVALQTPASATEVAHRLELPSPAAFDLGAGCAGFCHAVALANDAITSGTTRAALVVGSERLTDFIDPADRGTAPIFGDGAGAVVIGPADSPGIGPAVWGSEGANASWIAQPVDWVKAWEAGDLDARPVLHMDGRSVFRWATTQLAPLAREACARAGVTTRDLDAVVLHQANIRIVDAVVRALDLRDDVTVARNVTEVGNTSAASVPLALARLAELGQARSGGLALLMGFGAGMSYAGQVVRLP